SPEYSSMSANLTRDPPPQAPPADTVTPLVVYSPPFQQGSLAGVQIIGYRSTAAGTVEAARFNAADVAAATYVRDHVHVAINPDDPVERAMADEIIETIFNDIREAALNGAKTFQDSLGNIYRGADLVALIKNIDFNIYDSASAQVAGVTTLRGAQTTFANFSDINAHATVTIELGDLAANLGSQLWSGGLEYAVNHELGHALPAGHQIAYQDRAAFLTGSGAGLNGAAQDQAWAASPEARDAEQFANTLGHQIATFTGSGWLVGQPPEGYWHGLQ
ncbi:hypothetical protein, partial [Caulobacter sp.]|uniref:hypothetical protein n=1 Tax=Caulobacter sp. TaxID=78 RepID=UPI002B498385